MLEQLHHEIAVKSPKKASSRMKRLAKKAGQAVGLAVPSETMEWRNSTAAYALKHGQQAMRKALGEGTHGLGRNLPLEYIIARLFPQGEGAALVAAAAAGLLVAELLLLGEGFLEVIRREGDAGPGYVEMPKSRFGRLFGRKRRKEQVQESTPQEWLNVEDDFEAQQVGASRGGWESFRQEDAPNDQTVAGRSSARGAACCRSSIEMRGNSWDTPI